MITGIAFCPQAPALVPDLGRGAEDELDAVRQAIRRAVRRVVDPGGAVVVLGAGDAGQRFDAISRGSFAGFGVDLTVPLGSEQDGPVDLPPALAVGAWLVRDAVGPDSGATGWAVGPDEGALPRLDGGPTALVVIGDGSARRSAKAPGHLDERAAGFDAAVARALAEGDAAGLRAAAGAGAGLLAQGGRAWAAVAGIAGSVEWDAELLYDDAPLGVGYFVAAWTRRQEPPRG